ncbi:MAG TPA: hypothetical protein VFO38_05705 [Candidatus Saccharimonadales bacterium]|nr:hypothetical protein [Candidatus Saccharimonadales bacterium]
MTIAGNSSLTHVSELAQDTNTDPAAIEAACIELLPEWEDMVPTDQSRLFLLLAEAIGTDPNRLDAAAELANEAWQLAREDDSIVLAVEARCAYARFTAHECTTFEEYMGGTMKLGFHLLIKFAQLPSDEIDAITEALKKVYAHGVSLIAKGVLTD